MRSCETGRRCGKLYRVCLGITAFLFCLWNAGMACAMNVDYLDATKWQNNSHIISENINTSSLNQQLVGVFQYYADHHNMCLYTYFSIDETSISREMRDVRVDFQFHMPEEDYTFSVNGDGIYDSLDEEKKVFEVRSNFSGSTAGEYLCAAEFKGSDTACTVDVSLFVNGHKYVIKEGISLIKPTTTKPEKTTRTTTKTGRNTTTKTSRTGKSTTAGTTKYTPKTITSKYAAGTVTGGATALASGEDSTQTAVPYSEQKPTAKRKMTTSAKLFLYGGTAFAVAGIITLFIAVFSKDKKKKDD